MLWNLTTGFQGHGGAVLLQECYFQQSLELGLNIEGGGNLQRNGRRGSREFKRKDGDMESRRHELKEAYEFEQVHLH